jgi:hypothetical protein
MILSGIEVGNRPDSHIGIMGTNQQPWLPVEAIEFLEKNLSSSGIGFEFGSGSSSFWFSKLTGKLYSIESDILWHKMMLGLAEQNSITNINFSCISCDMLPIWNNDTEIGENYDLYSDDINKYDFNFDYILVDGVARSLCIKNSISKINPGGFLIIDNAERPAYWESMKNIPSSWDRYEFINSVDTTLIFVKPLQ